MCCYHKRQLFTLQGSIYLYASITCCYGLNLISYILMYFLVFFLEEIFCPKMDLLGINCISHENNNINTLSCSQAKNV